jgi:hypothetical protein
MYLLACGKVGPVGPQSGRARECEPTAQAIRNWVGQANRDEGRRAPVNYERRICPHPEPVTTACTAFNPKPYIVHGMANLNRLRRGPQDAPRDIQVPLAPSGSRRVIPFAATVLRSLALLRYRSRASSRNDLTPLQGYRGLLASVFDLPWLVARISLSADGVTPCCLPKMLVAKPLVCSLANATRTSRKARRVLIERICLVIASLIIGCKSAPYCISRLVCIAFSRNAAPTEETLNPSTSHGRSKTEARSPR